MAKKLKPEEYEEIRQLYYAGETMGNIAKKKPSYEFHDIPNENGGFFKFSINGIDSIKDDEEELINL